MIVLSTDGAIWDQRSGCRVDFNNSQLIIDATPYPSIIGNSVSLLGASLSVLFLNDSAEMIWLSHAAYTDPSYTDLVLMGMDIQIRGHLTVSVGQQFIVDGRTGSESNLQCDGNITVNGNTVNIRGSVGLGLGSEMELNGKWLHHDSDIVGSTGSHTIRGNPISGVLQIGPRFYGLSTPKLHISNADLVWQSVSVTVMSDAFILITGNSICQCGGVLNLMVDGNTGMAAPVTSPGNSILVITEQGFWDLSPGSYRIGIASIVNNGNIRMADGVWIYPTVGYQIDFYNQGVLNMIGSSTWGYQSSYCNITDAYDADDGCDPIFVHNSAPITVVGIWNLTAWSSYDVVNQTTASVTFSFGETARLVTSQLINVNYNSSFQITFVPRLATNFGPVTIIEIERNLTSPLSISDITQSNDAIKTQYVLDAAALPYRVRMSLEKAGKCHP
jgi:hypothetical protein